MAAPSAVGLSTGGKVFFGSLCAGTFGLGCWQTKRLFQKNGLVDSRTADLALEPTTDLAVLTEDAASQTNFRRVLLTGTFQHDQQVLVGPRGPPPGALPDGPGTSAAGMSQSPQGYFIITPLRLDPAHSNATKNSFDTVLVNRGWIPRHMAPPSKRELEQQMRARRQQQQRQPDQKLPELQEQQPELQWDRPQGTVHVTVVPAKAEQPRFIIPEHDLTTAPPKFYWFDLPTMRQLFLQTSKTTTTNTNAASADGSSNVPLVTVVRESSLDANGNAIINSNKQQSLEDMSWPITPTADKVGDFKVSPVIHAGYAVTWFGLSGAGLYMTRMLVTRGRK